MATTTPAAIASTIVVNARGTAAGGANAHFNLLVDGRTIGEGVAGTTARDFAFTAEVAPDLAHKVQIQYDNDAVINGVDRNLIVNTVTIGGKAVLPTAPDVTYDRFAPDGLDVIAGQSAMKWNGTLIIAADKSCFPASAGGINLPTTPLPPASALSVSDAHVVEPTAGAAGTGWGDATFTVKLSAASASTVKIGYATADGTAKAGSDYTAAYGTLTFAPGEVAKAVSVKVLSDGTAEGAETFSLKLSAPVAALLVDDTGVGTITHGATHAATIAAASASAQADAVYAHILAGQQAAATAAEAAPPVHAAIPMAADMHAYMPPVYAHPFDTVYDVHQDGFTLG